MTLAANQVITAYYGPSIGGQQVLQEAQRYPEDCDGIVADDPCTLPHAAPSVFLVERPDSQKTSFTMEQEANVIAAGSDYMAANESPQPLASSFPIRDATPKTSTPTPLPSGLFSTRKTPT